MMFGLFLTAPAGSGSLDRLVGAFGNRKPKHHHSDRRGSLLLA
jgi:hypothetical protein